MKAIPHPITTTPHPSIIQNLSPIGDTKMKEEKTKREIRVPRIVVYLISTLVCMLMAVVFTLCFGVVNAIDCLTVVAEIYVLASVVTNIGERLSAKKYHLLTSKYWVMMALILACDGLFAFSSYSSTMEILAIRGAFFLLALIVTILFAVFVYKPSVITLMTTAEENTVKMLGDYLGDTEKAKGVIALLKAPKKEEEKSEE